MYKASADILLPTSIIGSLPRAAWHNWRMRLKLTSRDAMPPQ
jgi:hypothetical protein